MDPSYNNSFGGSIGGAADFGASGGGALKGEARRVRWGKKMLLIVGLLVAVVLVGVWGQCHQLKPH